MYMLVAWFGRPCGSLSKGSYVRGHCLWSADPREYLIFIATRGGGRILEVG